MADKELIRMVRVPITGMQEHDRGYGLYLDEFRAAVEASIAKVPPEYRDKTQVYRGGSTMCYGTPLLAFVYTRPYTEEELKSDEAHEAREAKERRRAMYERLRSEFE